MKSRSNSFVSWVLKSRFNMVSSSSHCESSGSCWSFHLNFDDFDSACELFHWRYNLQSRPVHWELTARNVVDEAPVSLAFVCVTVDLLVWRVEQVYAWNKLSFHFMPTKLPMVSCLHFMLQVKVAQEEITTWNAVAAVCVSVEFVSVPPDSLDPLVKLQVATLCLSVCLSLSLSLSLSPPSSSDTASVLICTCVSALICELGRFPQQLTPKIVWKVVVPVVCLGVCVSVCVSCKVDILVDASRGNLPQRTWQRRMQRSWYLRQRRLSVWLGILWTFLPNRLSLPFFSSCHHLGPALTAFFTTQEDIFASTPKCAKPNCLQSRSMKSARKI